MISNGSLRDDRCWEAMAEVQILMTLWYFVAAEAQCMLGLEHLIKHQIKRHLLVQQYGSYFFAGFMALKATSTVMELCWHLHGTRC